MTKKLAIWSLLLALGGIAWLCYKGGDYFASKASVNLSSFTPIYCLIDCQFLCKNFESIESNTLPKFNTHNVVIKRLPTYSNDRVLLTRIFAQTPEFIQCRVENAIITGFTGLAPPTINIKMALSPDINTVRSVGATWLAISMALFNIWELPIIPNRCFIACISMILLVW